MKITNLSMFLIGIFVLAFLFIGYFVPIKIEEGSNFIIEDSLLGIMIFHNPFILAVYILIAVFLIVKGVKK